MNILNSKTNESNKFIYQFTDKPNLKNPNKNIALANLSIYYTWKNIKSEYNNKIFTSTWNDERKNIFACLFSVHNTISLSRHEQVCLMRLRFKRYFSHHRALDLIK